VKTVASMRAASVRCLLAASLALMVAATTQPGLAAKRSGTISAGLHVATHIDAKCDVQVPPATLGLPASSRATTGQRFGWSCSPGTYVTWSVLSGSGAAYFVFDPSGEPDCGTSGFGSQGPTIAEAAASASLCTGPASVADVGSLTSADGSPLDTVTIDLDAF
jgi:hypothetical protein